MRMILQYLSKPQAAYENLLAMSVQAKVEDSIMATLALMIYDLKSKQDQQMKLDLMLDSLDRAIEETENQIKAAV